MYKNKSNPNSIGGSTINLSSIVEGTDVFNSEILYKITKFPKNKLESYKVTVLNLRPSSVAKDIYGNPELSWIIILFNSKYSGKLRYDIGDIIEYPKLQELYKFIES